MAVKTYRYRRALAAEVTAKMGTLVDPGPTLVADTVPNVTVDWSIEEAQKPDLDSAAGELGWVFVQEVI